MIFALVLQPIYGALSDRIGRKPLLIWFGVMGTLFTIPLLRSLQGTRSALVAWLLIAAAWLIVAGYTSINAVVKAELFPTNVRATGVGAAVRRHGVDLRRHRRIARALVQVDRPRGLVLVLPDRGDRHFAGGLCVDARYPAALGDGPARMTHRRAQSSSLISALTRVRIASRIVRTCSSG